MFYVFFTSEILLFLFSLRQLLCLFHRHVISSSLTLCNSHALVPLCHPLLHSLFFSFVPSGLPLSLTFIAFICFPFTLIASNSTLKIPSARAFSFSLPFLCFSLLSHPISFLFRFLSPTNIISSSRFLYVFLYLFNLFVLRSFRLLRSLFLFLYFLFLTLLCVKHSTSTFHPLLLSRSLKFPLFSCFRPCNLNFVQSVLFHPFPSAHLHSKFLLLHPFNSHGFFFIPFSLPLSLSSSAFELIKVLFTYIVPHVFPLVSFSTLFTSLLLLLLHPPYTSNCASNSSTLACFFLTAPFLLFPPFQTFFPLFS